MVQVWVSSVQIVVSPSSSLADHSFNESVFDGICDFFKSNYGQNFVTPNPDYLISQTSGLWRRARTSEPFAYIEAYHASQVTGANLIVCDGFEQAQPLMDLSNSHESGFIYQSIKSLGLIFVDGSLNSKALPNIVTIAYKVDNAAFEAGVLTGFLLNSDPYYQRQNVNFNSEEYRSNREILRKSHPELKQNNFYEGEAYFAGGFMGLALGSTLPFLNGWVSGLNYFNDNYALQNLQLPLSNVKQRLYPVVFISPSDSGYNDLTMQSFTSGSFAPDEVRAKTIVDSLLNSGASAILPVAGPQSAMAAKEIYSTEKHASLIGVDTPQEDDPTVNLYRPDGHSVIAFSILKKLGDSMKNVLTAIRKRYISQSKSDWYGWKQTINGYGGFGYDNVGDLENGGVGVSQGKGYRPTNDPSKKYFQVDKFTEKYPIEETAKKLKFDGLEFTKPQFALAPRNSGDVGAADASTQKIIITAPQINSSTKQFSDNTYTPLDPSSFRYEKDLAKYSNIEEFFRSSGFGVGPNEQYTWTTWAESFTNEKKWYMSKDNF